MPASARTMRPFSASVFGVALKKSYLQRARAAIHSLKPLHMDGGIDERRRQKKASHGDADARNHLPILQSIQPSGKTRARDVLKKNGGGETSSDHNWGLAWS